MRKTHFLLALCYFFGFLHHLVLLQESGTIPVFTDRKYKFLSLFILGVLAASIIFLNKAATIPIPLSLGNVEREENH